MTDGVGLLPIMRAGGWKSTNIIGRYVEHTETLCSAKCAPPVLARANPAA